MFFLRPSHGLRVICHLPEAVSKPSSDPWKQQRTQVNIVNMRVPLEGEHGKCMNMSGLRKRNSSGHLEEASPKVLNTHPSAHALIHPSVLPSSLYQISDSIYGSVEIKCIFLKVDILTDLYITSLHSFG